MCVDRLRRYVLPPAGYAAPRQAARHIPANQRHGCCIRKCPLIPQFREAGAPGPGEVEGEVDGVRPPRRKRVHRAPRDSSPPKVRFN